MLYETIRDASIFLNERRPTNCQEFADLSLVIISDGEDRTSKLKVEDLIEHLKHHKVRVYAIAFIDELSTDRGFISKSPQEKSRDFLLKLAKETGGNVVFPKDGHSSHQIVTTLFQAVGSSNK